MSAKPIPLRFPLPVTLVDGAVGLTHDIIRSAFEDSYRKAYNRVLEGIAVRILSLRTAVIGRRRKFDLESLKPTADATTETARTGERAVWLDGDWRTAAIFDRLALPIGARLEGPAILEQPDATILIDPGLAGRGRSVRQRYHQAGCLRDAILRIAPQHEALRIRLTLRARLEGWDRL